MLDKSLPYFNIIMKYPELIDRKNASLPPGYTIRYFRPGDEDHWAAIEASVGEFGSPGEALSYFYDNYMTRRDELEKRCVFVLDTNGEPVGTCTAWREESGGVMVNSLHWLAAYPDCQGLGIGKALVSKVLEIYRELGDMPPVYLHTQTWSYRAVGIYLQSGFRALKRETFSRYKNDFTQAIGVLEGVMYNDIYRLFIDSAI